MCTYDLMVVLYVKVKVSVKKLQCADTLICPVLLNSLNNLPSKYIKTLDLPIHQTYNRDLEKNSTTGQHYRKIQEIITHLEKALGVCNFIQNVYFMTVLPIGFEIFSL